MAIAAIQTAITTPVATLISSVQTTPNFARCRAAPPDKFARRHQRRTRAATPRLTGPLPVHCTVSCGLSPDVRTRECDDVACESQQQAARHARRCAGGHRDRASLLRIRRSHGVECDGARDAREETTSSSVIGGGDRICRIRAASGIVKRHSSPGRVSRASVQCACITPSGPW